MQFGEKKGKTLHPVFVVKILSKLKEKMKTIFDVDPKL
jgi:hypothetical protein